MAEMKYILGIDQGGSKTAAVIGDGQGNILGAGQSHGACHALDGMETAMDAVKQAADAACEKSGIHIGQITSVSAGMTGADWDFEVELLRGALQKRLNIEDVTVYNDCIAALRAGTDKPYGAVICAGSGLNCAVKAPDGGTFIYGYYIDNEYQGGRGLAAAAIRAVIEASVGLRDPTSLTELILTTLGLPSAEELLFHQVNGKITSEQCLQLPKIIDKAAASGDKTAAELFTRFGQQCGVYIKTAVERMGLTDTVMDIVLAGGLFKCETPYIKKGIADVLSAMPSITFVDAAREPAIGAYWLGLDKLIALPARP